MKRLLLLCMLLVNISLGAGPKASEEPLKGFELGVSAGLPWGVGLDFQYWNLFETNLLLRSSVSSLILLLETFSGSIGYIVDNTGPNRHSFNLSYSFTKSWMLNSEGYTATTINYNYRIHPRNRTIIFEVGISYFRGEGLIPTGKITLY